MKPAPFDYARPSTLDGALDLIDGTRDAMVMAGGQSLLAMLNLRVASAELIVDIGGVAELRGAVEENDVVEFGALTTHALIEDGRLPDPTHGLMPRIASKIAYRAIRNLGTIGGSLSLADPSADWPACLLALGADIVLQGPDGARTVAMDDFLLGAYETALVPGELLARIRVPRLAARCWGTGKVMRKSGAFADSLAVAVLGGGGRATRIALTGTTSHARLLVRTAAAVDRGAAGAELKTAILADIDEVHEDATPYQRRCHLATALEALAEARRW